MYRMCVPVLFFFLLLGAVGMPKGALGQTVRSMKVQDPVLHSIKLFEMALTRVWLDIWSSGGVRDIPRFLSNYAVCNGTLPSYNGEWVSFCKPVDLVWSKVGEAVKISVNLAPDVSVDAILLALEKLLKDRELGRLSISAADAFFLQENFKKIIATDPDLVRAAQTGMLSHDGLTYPYLEEFFKDISTAEIIVLDHAVGLMIAMKDSLSNVHSGMTVFQITHHR